MKRRSIKPLWRVVLLGLLCLAGLMISNPVYSAQQNNLGKSNVKQTMKPQYANTALPISAAVRPGNILIFWMEPAGVPPYSEGFNIYREDQDKNQIVKLNIQPIRTANAVTASQYLTAGSVEMQEIATVLKINPDSPGQFFAANIKDPNDSTKILFDRDSLRQVLQQLYPGAARAMGRGYLDQTTLVSGKTYTYKVIPIVGGQESPINSGSVSVANHDSSAGMTLPAPIECLIYQGDQSIELLWPKGQTVLAYDIYRAPSSNPGQLEKLNKFAMAMVTKVANNAPTGIVDKPLIKVRPSLKPVDQKFLSNNSVNYLGANPKTMSYYVDNTIVSNPIPPKTSPVPTPTPTPKYEVVHEVKNGVTYQYRIVPRDILGPASNPSQYLTLKATARDLLKPGIPDPLIFTVIQRNWTLPVPNTQPGCCAVGCPLCEPNWLYPKSGTVYDKIHGGLSIGWSPVLLNEEGYPEEIASYKLWRYDTQVAAGKNEPNKRTLIGTRTVNNYTKTIYALSDTTAKSETMYWYRVEALDKANHSNFSAVFSASFQDNLPPLSPANVRVTNANLTEIKVEWDPSKDGENSNINATDLGGYRVYRRVCGTRPARNADMSVGHTPGGIPTAEEVKAGNYKDFFLLIATVPVELDQTWLIDKTLPADSPYSYEYCVRAYDKSQNMSKDHLGNVTCGRLTKQKGPRAATITSLQARSNSIRIDWVAPPSVDLYTFRIYRSEQADHSDWKKVTFDPQFTELHCWDTPLNPPDFASGLTPDQTKSAGKPPIYQGAVKNTYYFIDDQTIAPNKKYWYRIVSYDYLQNPQPNSPYLKDSTSPVMSTFTYEKYIAANLSVQVPTYNPLKGVVVNWTPPTGISGITYLVYRSNKSASDGFVSLAAALTNNNYIDATARPGVTYWYKVQYMTTASGHYSAFSDVVTLNVK
jgi:hypothetical protein